MYITFVCRREFQSGSLLSAYLQQCNRWRYWPGGWRQTRLQIDTSKRIGRFGSEGSYAMSRRQSRSEDCKCIFNWLKKVKHSNFRRCCTWTGYKAFVWLFGLRTLRLARRRLLATWWFECNRIDIISDSCSAPASAKAYCTCMYTSFDQRRC